MEKSNSRIPSKSTTYYLLPTTYQRGFTIIELLVTIVIIGILAALTTVAYTGIQSRAAIAALKSDLGNASTRLGVDIGTNGHYPATEAEANGGKGLSKSPGTVFQYTLTDGEFCLSATSARVGTSVFHVSSSKGVIEDGVCPQVWAKVNLNVGTMVTGVTNQTNNSILEKYCYNNTESNCTTYGGLYQWDEAMQYVTTEGAQGICPVGSHIPSDNDWKILEMQLGMTQVQADATGWRGTDQGTKLMPGGTSGLNIPLAGYRYTNGSFYFLSSDAYLWSSSESSPNAWYRYLTSSFVTVGRGTRDKGYGFSVRCMGN